MRPVEENGSTDPADIYDETEYLKTVLMPKADELIQLARAKDLPVLVIINISQEDIGTGIIANTYVGGGFPAGNRTPSNMQSILELLKEKQAEDSDALLGRSEGENQDG